MSQMKANEKVLRFPLTADDLRRAGDAARHDARRAKRIQRRALVAIVVAVIAIALIVVFSSHLGNAKGSSQRTKKLTSVYVESGDSLWSIAEEFYTSECGDMKDYIKEIKLTNGLDSNTIRYGYTLLVPYYE
ncbi:MAG: LysM peptidoglycan-binding domain-containing protein [Lachnospiraceae bacterium]|nr:LysM peptidoglycan-binding domain-containing protein [Lachnospiraceae bacterium]